MYEQRHVSLSPRDWAAPNAPYIYYLWARTIQCCVWLVKSVSDRACTLSLKPGGARPLYGKRTKRIS